MSEIDPFKESMNDEFNVMFFHMSMDDFFEKRKTNPSYEPSLDRVGLVVKDIYKITPLEAKKLTGLLTDLSKAREDARLMPSCVDITRRYYAEHPDESIITDLPQKG